MRVEKRHQRFDFVGWHCRMDALHNASVEFLPAELYEHTRANLQGGLHFRWNLVSEGGAKRQWKYYFREHRLHEYHLWENVLQSICQTPILFFMGLRLIVSANLVIIREKMLNLR